MKKIYLTFFLICSVLSCKDITSCTNADLSNYITVLGFGNLTTKTISFHRLNTNTDKFEKIKVKKIDYQNNKELTRYGQSEIILEENLFSEENYRLTIDNEKYDITDIKIQSEVRMKGMRLDSICRVSSFKINKKIANQIYYTSTITFKNPN